MAYLKLHPIKQFDFQINRILTYGDKACDLEEIKIIMPGIKDLDTWYGAWRSLGENAEAESRNLHAAYYYRLAEFFLKDIPEKEEMYQKSIENFHKIIDLDKNIRTEYISYENSAMKSIVFEADNPIGNIVAFGGYDSYIEEFYLPIKELTASGYNVYAFEGPGQGSTLKSGMVFEPQWEKPTGAVLDYFELNNVFVIGISWGGYFALQSAAFDSRISKAVAYDVLYDGFDCMTNPFPHGVKAILNLLFRLRAKALVNFIVRKLMKRKLIVDWAISHGLYITGTDNPYDFYLHLKKHTLKDKTALIKCDVLLLAGEHDHYIPKKHFDILMKNLPNAKTVTGRVFTESEGGAEHCQIGNHMLAINCILSWLNDAS